MVLTNYLGSIRRALKGLSQTRNEYWASRIRKAISGLGTDDAALIRAFVLNSREQLKQVEAAYLARNSKQKGDKPPKKEKKEKKEKKKSSGSLQNDIKGDTSGWYEKSLLSLLN